MDYKELLHKYMKHVLWEEGTTFVHDGSWLNSLFTEEEWEELKRIRGPIVYSKEPLSRSPEYIKEQKEWLLTQLQHNTK